MAKFELASVKDKDGTPITIGNNLTGEVLEFDPDSNTKYIFVFDMGPMSGDVIGKQLEKWSAMLREFLGPGRCLVSARTQSDQNPVKVYELQPIAEE